MNLEVGGDPEGGWLVNIHDGAVNAVHKLGAECATPFEAAMAALKAHFEEKPAPSVAVQAQLAAAQAQYEAGTVANDQTQPEPAA